tara:strand:- start:25 stop:237 length:213 start_codon:yes stop_codon:yes gene_type:complete
MTFARLYADEAQIRPGTVPHLGSRHYVELELDLTAAQWREALGFLLSQMSENEGREFLRAEFPELLTEAA